MKALLLLLSNSFRESQSAAVKKNPGWNMVSSESESVYQEDRVWEFLENFCDLITNKEFYKGALLPALIIFKLMVILHALLKVA